MIGTDEQTLGARIAGIAHRWPCVGLAVGLVRDGSPAMVFRHGLADIASHTPVTDETVFRIGSITKTMTAVAVMQLYERGLIDLDAPAGAYLRAYRPVPSPAAYYRGRLPIHADPGSRFMYTNHGFVTLGQIVADVSGMPLEEYLRDNVFDPLGMEQTDLVRSERVRHRPATGYELRRRGAVPVPDYNLITAGAGGVYSTPRDMRRYLAALLGGGTNRYGSILTPAGLAAMFAPQYRPDPRIPGIGLSFFRVDLDGWLAVEHDGVLPGFDTQILLVPDAGCGVVALANGARRRMHWLAPEAADLLRCLLAVPAPVVRTEIPQRPEVWATLCGRYRLSAYWTDPARFVIGAGVEVFVRRGRLMMRFLSPIPALCRGFPLLPDDVADPYVFRTDLPSPGPGTGRVVFAGAPGADATTLYLDFGPLALTRRAPKDWP